MTIEVIRGKGTPTSHLPFSPAIKAGDFVFVSGQASVDETGKIVVARSAFHRPLDARRDNPALLDDFVVAVGVTGTRMRGVAQRSNGGHSEYHDRRSEQ